MHCIKTFPRLTIFSCEYSRHLADQKDFTKCEENFNADLTPPLLSLTQREKLKNEMAGLRSKNEKLENLCRALHKGAKVTSTDIDQVLTLISCLYQFWRKTTKQSVYYL